MLVLLSPAKTLDLETPPTTRKHSQPRHLTLSEELIAVLRPMSPDDVARLLGISTDLAELNVARYHDFDPPFTSRNARQAALMFAGDTYQGLDARNRFGERDWTEAQKTVRILSGLYGLLRPLDLIQPYRLEMGTLLRTDRGDSLVEFWGDTILEQVREDLAASPGPAVVVNLASAEYSRAARLDEVGARVLTPRFEDRTASGAWKVVSFSAKRARGAMAGWLVTERARSLTMVQGFTELGYRYAAEMSSPDEPVFRRVPPAR